MRASIIVPAYNASATIEPCLAALVAQQKAPPFEIIVVDDGSQDATSEIVARFSQVRLIRSSHRGAAAARNRGAREACGGILLFTDSDCEPAPDWLCEMLASFADNSIVGVKGVYRTRQRERIARFVQLEYEEKYARMSGEQTIDFIDTYSAGYRRDVFLANGGFDELFSNASVEDQEFSFRLAKQGLRMLFALRAIVYHQHVTTWLAYARRKFRIGYWKVQVHLRHPEKAWRDSHTPTTLKWQVTLPLGILACLFISIAFPMALIGALGCALIFSASIVPLYLFVRRRDADVAFIVPAMIFLRAAALGFGLGAGVCGAMWSWIIRGTKRFLSN